MTTPRRDFDVVIRRVLELVPQTETKLREQLERVRADAWGRLRDVLSSAIPCPVEPWHFGVSQVIIGGAADYQAPTLDGLGTLDTMRTSQVVRLGASFLATSTAPADLTLAHQLRHRADLLTAAVDKAKSELQSDDSLRRLVANCWLRALVSIGELYPTEVPL